MTTSATNVEAAPMQYSDYNSNIDLDGSVSILDKSLVAVSINNKGAAGE